MQTKLRTTIFFIWFSNILLLLFHAIKNALIVFQNVYDALPLDLWPWCVESCISLWATLGNLAAPPSLAWIWAQNTAKLLSVLCSWFSNWSLVFKVVYYYKMVKFDFRTYCNTRWIIFGTSNMFTKYGPLHSLFITKTLQKIQEKNQTSFKAIGFTYRDFQPFVNFGKDGHRQIPKNRLMISPKSWIRDQHLSQNTNGLLLIWHQYLPQNMKWQFGNFGFL